MIFELPEEGYRFNIPPDEDWLPSPYHLFGPESEVERSPSQDWIRRKCETIQASWDSREKFLRKLRAQKACESGICRNF